MISDVFPCCAEILEGFAWPTMPIGHRNSLVYALSFDHLVIRLIDCTLCCCFRRIFWILVVW